ncbi:MAG: dihydrolipoyl dehydrogenase [Alphaproteobacteria bacterium]|jgi:dihydrolipoamide dehydrogenase|nr:dihydrolipoyl dehydrogenase [Alphaproteobacteria bacterium]
MAEQQFDLVVIGAGPGGYEGAIRAAQLGMSVAVVEKRGALGGTCVTVGCIPSKALLQSSELYEETTHALADHGIKVAKVDFDLAAMMARKDAVVNSNTSGVEFLFKKNKITWVKGTGKLAGNGRVDVALTDGGEQVLAAKNILIATGSDVTRLPGIEIDETQIVSSTGALTLPKVPKTLVVIGGGVIGLELGTVWRRLGAEVTVIEYLDRILPTMDVDLGKNTQRVLAKQGMKFKLGAKVTAAKKSKSGVTLTVEPAKGGTPEEITADVVLVAIGRVPYTDGLGAKEIGVALDERGRVRIDAHFQTNVPGIYAIGDVVAGAMLAHKASEEAIACVEMLAGQKPHVNYDAIPGIVYTWPEVAAVGKTEEELKAAGIDYKVGKFPFSANGRARANGDTDGFVKILADAKTDKVLGCHILGPDAGNLIHEAVIAIEFGASSEDLARTCHGHPTLNEAVKEAALAVDKRTINL